MGELLRSRGFDVYVAINVQTILEINNEIIRELKNSDCYLFVNFRRDQIGAEYRGSLFSNQELAIAYALGFKRILVINQTEIKSEGMLRYIANNTESFADLDGCCAAVQRALDRSGWEPNYSRRLTAGMMRFSDTPIQYGNLVGKFLYLDIHNHRPDIAALEATAKLSAFAANGHPLQPCPIRSPLKATGRRAFSHTIFPNSHEAFDLLCVGGYIKATGPISTAPPVSGSLVSMHPVAVEPGVFLNSDMDVVGAPRLQITPGTWNLNYTFYAIDFPVLSVMVELAFTDWNEPSARVLSQETV